MYGTNSGIPIKGALLNVMTALAPTAMPHFIVLDHQLPGAKGGDMVVRLRSHSHDDRTAIAIDATAVSLQRMQILKADGASLCLLKGISLAEILSQVRQFCRLAGQREVGHG